MMKMFLARAIHFAAILVFVSFGFSFVGTIEASPVSAHTSAMKASPCLQPPQNVDLTTLSDQALLSYGLPDHATINLNPQQWEKVLTHAKKRICGSFPSKFKITHNVHPDTGYSAANWAGNVANGSRGTYRAASVEFNVPYISFNNSNAEVGIWAGVGGVVSSYELVQAGIYTYIYKGNQYNVSFWQVAPEYNQAQDLPIGSISVGNSIYSYAESNLNNDNKNYFFNENETTGDFNSYTLANNIFSDSATGECIVERPKVDGSFTPLLEFNPNGDPKDTETLDNCTISTNSGSNGIGNDPHYYYSMYNGNDLLAYPEPIFGNGYDYLVKWVAST
jgi:hypothetical protein